MYSEIAVALSGVKAAIDIGKAVAAADNAMESALLKIKMAELVSSLLDAKLAIVSTQEIIELKEREIKRLEAAFEMAAKVQLHGDAYYELNEQGAPHGKPYCMNCWEADHRLHHIAGDALGAGAYQCLRCKAYYNGERIRQFA
jgi:hypothetical protein